MIHGKFGLSSKSRACANVWEYLSKFCGVAMDGTISMHAIGAVKKWVGDFGLEPDFDGKS